MTALFVAGLLTLGADAPAADGWTDLLVAGEKTPWVTVHKDWVFAADAKLDSKGGKPLVPVEPGKGPVWVNGPKGRLANLITKQDYKDCEVHVEVMMGKASNAGIKFHALYEIQFRDSYGKTDKLTGNDMGGIYPPATDKPKYAYLTDGTPPKVNAAKPAGEWQTLDVTWRAPRFNDKGEKTESGKVVKATLNGKLIHENAEVTSPTGTNHVKKDTPSGPFMLQCDHGPVAWRNVKIREIK